jgi:oligoribonuclease (3'-5' exoribonuclease)
MSEQKIIWIKNKMTGLDTPVLEVVYKAYKLLELAEFNFKTFVEKYHDSTSIESAEFYLELLDTWCDAKKLFSAYKNEWYIAREGISLN